MYCRIYLKQIYTKLKERKTEYSRLCTHMHSDNHTGGQSLESWEHKAFEDKIFEWQHPQVPRHQIGHRRERMRESWKRKECEWLREKKRETFSQSRLKLIGIQILPTNTSPFCLSLSPPYQLPGRPAIVMPTSGPVWRVHGEWSPQTMTTLFLSFSSLPFSFSSAIFLWPSGSTWTEQNDHNNSYNHLAARWKRFDSIHNLRFSV